MDVLSGSKHGPGLDADTLGEQQRIRLHALTNTLQIFNVLTTEYVCHRKILPSNSYW
jgi:hypothetical protein